MSEPLDWSAHLVLMQQMARLAQKRSIPVTFPTKNQPFFQLGQGVHGRSFSYQSLSQMQEGLGQGGQLLWGEWLDREFPVDQCGMRGRIPTVGITGSVGKTTTAQMVAAILRASGRCVALSTTQGAWIGEQQVTRGDVAGGSMALNLMRDSRVEAGVFEFARGGLIKFGMQIDSVNVAAVLNIYDNHLGLNGINTREELARVKRIVAESAKDWVVLNADDPHCLGMIPFLTCRRLCLFSRDQGNSQLIQHRAEGGSIVYWQGENADARIVLSADGQVKGEIGVAEIADTHGGRFLPAAVNASFAIGIAFGLGVDFETIRKGLVGFESTLKLNPGRNNLVRGLPYTLLVSHADGPEASRALADFARTIPCSGRRRLLLCSAGDRSDRFIQGMARELAGGFSEYICTDFYQPRGRPKGEVAHLLAAALQESGVEARAIRVVVSPSEAVILAYAELNANDLLVDNSYDSSAPQKWLQQRGLDRHPAYNQD